MGRPSDYSEERGDALCARLADGASLRAACEADDMPSTTTVFRWLRVHAEFREQYARACEARAHAYVEDIPDIADDGTNDWMERRNKDGELVGWVVNGEAVQRSKLRVDARKWLAAKMNPKVYGDAMTLKGDKDNPLHPDKPVDLSDAALAAIAAQGRKDG